MRWYERQFQRRIEEITKLDSDTKEILGFINTSWVFEEVAREISYPIFMAETENIGYKRTKRGEKPQPNNLFDLEVAPDKLNLSAVKNCYEEEYQKLSTRKISLEGELAKHDDNEKKKVQILSRLKKLNTELVNLEEEKTKVW